jgi:2'-5' RNA ligase
MSTIFLTLKLDLATETAVRDHWQRLRAAGLTAPGPTALRPHITLVGYDDVAPEAAAPLVHAFVARRPSPMLNFHSLGIFPQKRVLYLAVVANRALLRLQRELHTTLQSAGLPPLNNPHFYPDRWIPHCSLLIGASPSGLQQGLDLLVANWEPRHGRAAGIGLVRFPDKKDRYFFPFAVP